WPFNVHGPARWCAQGGDGSGSDAVASRGTPVKETAMHFAHLLERFAAAVEALDGDALADLFTPEGTYDDYFFGPSTGREAIKNMLAHFAAGGRDFRWEFYDAVASGTLGYASYRFSFNSTHGPARGARVVFDGIARLDLANGRIQRYGEVFDRGMALAQQ